MQELIGGDFYYKRVYEVGTELRYVYIRGEWGFE